MITRKEATDEATNMFDSLTKNAGKKSEKTITKMIKKIKKGKLRGVESFGMCCSSRELKMGDDHSGIIEFPPETPARGSALSTQSSENPRL